MRIGFVIVVPTFIAQAHASQSGRTEESSVTSYELTEKRDMVSDSMDKHTGGTVDDLVVRMLNVVPLHSADLDSTTLEKVNFLLASSPSSDQELPVSEASSTRQILKFRLTPKPPTEHQHNEPPQNSLPIQSSELRDGPSILLRNDPAKLMSFELDGFGACSADDQTAVSVLGGGQNNGGWGKICSDCAHSALNIFRGIHQDKFSKCLAGRTSISAKCSMCFAEAAQYAFKHCKTACWHHEKSESCRLCIARFDIDDCTGFDVAATLRKKSHELFEHLPKTKSPQVVSKRHDASTLLDSLFQLAFFQGFCAT